MNPNNTQPADSTLACPIAHIPEDVWFHISEHLIKTHVTDFSVCTAHTMQADVKQPLSSIDKDHDFVLRGVPVNGHLYITDVPQQCAHLGETHLHPSRGNVAVDDNGPWYSVLHRDANKNVDHDKTAMCPSLYEPRHRFYKEKHSDSVMLRCSLQELLVVNERHSIAELGQGGGIQEQLQQRHSRVKFDDRVQFLRISEASTRALRGDLTILALCKALKLKAKLSIIGKMPLMTRLDVYNPRDNLRDMTTPVYLRAQMRYSIGKWLCLVPLHWIAAQQGNGGVRTSAILKGTSFVSIAPMMVYAFFCCSNRFVCVNSENLTSELLGKAKSGGFREEFALNGPHVHPAQESESLCVSKLAPSTDGFGGDPTLELFGGFAGIL